MTIFQVYRKTLGFSFISFLVDLLTFFAFVGLPTAGFFIFNRSSGSAGLVGLVVGFVIGIIVVILVTIFISNRVKAAQISMMVKGVVDGELPNHCVKAGFGEIRGRFGKITVFYFITNAIKNIFRQIGRFLNKLGTAIGGEVGGTVTSVVDSAVQTLIAYLCDCCLGWILYQKDTNPFKAGCEGCAIFFKNGKSLLRNVGRIFGMGFLSFAVIGGAFFGLSYVIFMQFPQMFEALVVEFEEIAASDGGTVPEFFASPYYLMLVFCGATGVIFWSILHSVLIRPFILVGVLRNFMAAGLKDRPTENDFAQVAAKSPKFAKLQSRIE